jgi:hypothetical protein
MTRIVCLMVCGVLLAGSNAFAQAPPGGGGGQAAGIAAGLQASYNRIKNLVTLSAEKMPEGDYGFKPNMEIRNYCQLWAHVANFHFGTCATSLGMPNPNQGVNLENTATTKEAVVKALADSFVLCDKAFAALTDQTAAEGVAGGRGGPVARGTLLNRIVEHDNEMYGIGTVYLRLKNLVPPSTELQQQRGGGPAGGGARGAGRGN